MGAIAREVALFGARGDGKTWAALIAMIMHAQEHSEQGYKLPVPWIGVRDSHQAHRLTTCRTLQAPAWQGLWTLKDDQHVAVCALGGRELVRLDLFGVEDQGAMDRLRMECAGVWFEEPAPASVMVQSSGISEDAWGLAITSQRVPSHCHPAMLTSNYPDDDHWTWKRFVTSPKSGTSYVRIPPGERASEADRAEWARALEGRPDMLRRLLLGEPGVLAQGPEVAQGWNPLAHIAPHVIEAVPSEPLWWGWDAGHTPTCIIGQAVRGELRILAGLVTEHSGMRQHLDATVLPWLSRHAPWALGREHAGNYHRFDPSMDTTDDTDREQSPTRIVQATLGGSMLPGSVSWVGRKDPLLSAFNLSRGGVPALRVSPGPDTDLLRKALDGRWYYPMRANGEVARDLPAKPNHPWEDLGDALCYLIGGMAPTAAHRDLRPPRVEADFSIFGREPEVLSDFAVLGPGGLV